MNLINNLKDNSLLITNNQDKYEILNYMSANSIFLNLDFYIFGQSYSKLSNNYPFIMSKHFGIDPSLSERIKKYFDYISVSKQYELEKIEELKNIKKYLIDSNVLMTPNNKYSSIYQVDEVIVPSFLSKSFQSLKMNLVSDKSVDLFKVSNKKAQVFFVFEKMIELIKSGININKINIVNSDEEDDLYLSKYFKDARINYNINKKIRLKSYPVMIELVKMLKSKRFIQAKEHVESIKNIDIKKKIIRVFNSFEDELIISNLDVFSHELEKITIKEPLLKNACNIVSFNDLVYKADEYYIIMNYYEECFPTKVVDNDYLSDEEAKIIDYPTSLDLNLNKKITVENILQRIDNLILVYPERIIDETYPSRLDLSRDIINKEYTYRVHNESYLNDLLFLDYAKKIHDYHNYNLLSDDLTILNNTFNKDLVRFTPYYSGIKDNILNSLISSSNTLTAYKLKSFNLCPFQYYLKYLLKFDKYEDSVFTYIGNVIHKALESYSKTLEYDLDEIFSMYDFPEEEIYKKEVYQDIIKDNVKVIVDEVKNFELNSRFLEKYSEKAIDIKLNDTFKITGIIDKVMIDRETGYFLVIDYKYGDQDFNKSDFSRDYNIQLPLYLYSLKIENPDLKPAAMLYQKTALNKDERGKSNDYKMKGIVINLAAVAERIDPDFSHITGVRLLKDGTLAKNENTLVTEQEFDELINKCEKIISKSASRIKDGDFEIKPILSEFDKRSKSSISCRYCEYGSICYSKNKILGGE